MGGSLIAMQYFETYYYANVVHNVLKDPAEYLSSLHKWHEDCAADLFLTPFPKWSALHGISNLIIEELLFERLDDVDLDSVVNDSNSELWVDHALRHHGIQIDGFRIWLMENSKTLSSATEDDVFDYHVDLRLTGELDTLLTQLSNEVFFLLFSNRMLLARLNNYISCIVHGIEKKGLAAEQEKLMIRDGVLARAHIPEWVKRAVFFRDRGMCTSCTCDLTGLLTMFNDKHFDHIIPLVEGGINDITNIQLLCEICNKKKGPQIIGTSNRYQAWYA